MDDNYTTYDIPFVPNREFTITSSDGFEENVTSNDSDVQIDKNKIMQNCRECVKYAKYTNGIKITKHQQKHHRY